MFGRTDNNETVMVARRAPGMSQVKPGDIPSALLVPPRFNGNQPPKRPVKWYAESPRLIAIGCEITPGTSETEGMNDFFGWKEHSEADLRAQE